MASQLFLKWNDEQNKKKIKKLKKQNKKNKKKLKRKDDKIDELKTILIQNGIQINGMRQEVGELSNNVRELNKDVRELKQDIIEIIPDRAESVNKTRVEAEKIVVLKILSVYQKIINYFLKPFDPALFVIDELRDILFVLALVNASLPKSNKLLLNLIKNIESLNNNYNYSVIRGQQKHIDQTILDLQKSGLNVKIFYMFDDCSSVPRWRENVNNGTIKITSDAKNYTWFKLNDGIDESQFKEQLEFVKNKKFKTRNNDYSE